MSEEERLAEIEGRLVALAQTSFVAHRDALLSLPAVRPAGSEAMLLWLDTGERLFMADREAGKAFFRGSPAVIAAFGGVHPWLFHLAGFAGARGSGPAVGACMARLPEAATVLGVECEEWLREGISWTLRHAESGRAYFDTGVAALTDHHRPGALRALLLPAEQLWAESGLALGRYLPGALAVRALLGDAGLAPWARHGGDILKAGRLRGEAFFSFESDESRALLLSHLPGFRPQDHLRLLHLLALAVVGLAPPFEESRWSPADGRPFIETDGQRLFLPAVVGTREEAIASLYHAAAHLRFDTFEQDAIARLFAAANVAHPPLDPGQHMTWRPLFASFGEDLPRAQVLFDLCEDLRVDHRLAEQLPNWWARLYRLPVVPGDASAQVYVSFARVAWASLARGAGIDPRLAPLLSPEATPVTAWQVALTLRSGGEFPVLELATRADAYPPAHGPNAARPIYPRATRGSNGAPDRDPSETSASQNRETVDQTSSPPQGAQGGDPDLEIPPENTQGAGGRVGVGLPQPAVVSGGPRGHRVAVGGMSYPEWDYRVQRYRPRWASVHTRVLDESDAIEAARILSFHEATLKRLKRAIESQRPTRLMPKRRQREGDDIDLDAAVAFAVERRSGQAPVPAIYQRRRAQRREFAVLLLADLSTSIMQRLPDGERIVDRMRAALVLFAEALDALGDAFGIAGFASKYRDQVSYYPIKHFDEPLTPAIRATLGGLSGRLATRMGAAMRHACTTFTPGLPARRLLLLLSDGRPSDYDDGGDARYLEEDTRLAVKHCLDQGIHPFCVTLDPRGGEYLRRIFGDGHYLVIDRVHELPARLPDVYLRLRST